MSKRGRKPLPTGFVLVKFFASREDADYLNDVRRVQELSTRTDALRLIVSDARKTDRFLVGTDANIAELQS